MSQAAQFYVSTLAIYAAVDVLAVWGLNLQFGTAGILSFAFIVFQAAGAYTCAVLALGPQSSNGGFQHYIGGLSLPFPIPLLGAMVAGAAISLPIGLVTLRRLRSDYQAVALLVTAVIASTIVTNETWLFNGAAGLALVPKPLTNVLNLDFISYQWAYAAFTIAICILGYFVIQRITKSPLGRAMRAMRDNESAALALGKNIVALRLVAFAVGGAFAGLSGGLLVQFITAWSPGGWAYIETIVLLSAIIIGGTGNTIGVVVGVLVVMIGFQEGSRFLPEFGRPGLVPALQWEVIGLLIIVFLWARPQGILPERKNIFRREAGAGGKAGQAVRK